MLEILLVYLGIINFITFITFAVDKRAAIRQRPRVRVRTLLGLAFVGGSLGGLLAMYLFRHKTKKRLFTVGIPLMMIVQIVAIVYLIKL